MTGTTGKENREACKAYHKFTRFDSIVPESLYEHPVPFRIQGPSKVGLLSDIHYPYHNRERLIESLNICKDKGVETLYLNGDVFDFPTLGKFGSDPRSPKPKEDIPQVRKLLVELKKEFKQVIFKEGNHDERMQRLIWQIGDAIPEVGSKYLAKCLSLEEEGIGHVRSKQIALIGDLPVAHGHEFTWGINDPVNIARGLFRKVLESCLIGHYHITSTHIEPTAISRYEARCYSVGSLCGLSPEYRPFNKWNNGFAILNVDETNTTSLDNYHWDNKGRLRSTD
jgi:predicted phosphodiesterase